MLCSHDTPGQEIVSETKTKRKREIRIKSIIGISITTEEQTTNTYQTYSPRYDNHALEQNQSSKQCAK